MIKALVIYWSKTGNTEKVAFAIKEGLKKAQASVLIKKVEEANKINFLLYDLVCIGCPSYEWHPPKPMVKFLKEKLNQYRKQGKVKIGAPKIKGKATLVFCTYSGPHTGRNEAIPVGKYLGQFFEHIGYTIIDEWYILSEFHGRKEENINGRMGDIRGKPNKEDLLKIKKSAKIIAKNLINSN
jgi:flavodoxin